MLLRPDNKLCKRFRDGLGGRIPSGWSYRPPVSLRPSSASALEGCLLRAVVKLQACRVQGGAQLMDQQQLIAGPPPLDSNWIQIKSQVCGLRGGAQLLGQHQLWRVRVPGVRGGAPGPGRPRLQGVDALTVACQSWFGICAGVHRGLGMRVSKLRRPSVSTCHWHQFWSRAAVVRSCEVLSGAERHAV